MSGVTDEEVLRIVDKTVIQRKVKSLGHKMRRNCFQAQEIERQINMKKCRRFEAEAKLTILKDEGAHCVKWRAYFEKKSLELSKAKFVTVTVINKIKIKYLHVLLNFRIYSF